MPAWNPVHRIDDDTTTENHEDTNVDNFDNIILGETLYSQPPTFKD